MSFAAPLFLTLTALAVPVIGLYLLKVRLRRIPVATQMFWKQVQREHPPRSLWKRLRHLASLLLQLAVLLLLALAAADPLWTAGSRPAQRTIVVLDNSASMQADDVAPSRFAAARREARRLVDELRPGDEMAILTASQPLTVLPGLTDHRTSLLDRIDTVAVTDSPAELRSAIRLARTLLADHPHGRVVVLTDGCAEPADLSALGVEPAIRDAGASGTGAGNESASSAVGTGDTPARSPAIDTRILAGPAGNVGITAFQSRRSLNDPLGYEVLISVRNAGAVAVDCQVELSLDDIPIDVLPLQLQPDETWTRSLEKTSVEGGILLARLLNVQVAADAVSPSAADTATVDALRVDNAARAVLPARQRQRVLLVSPGNSFLQRVFEAHPLVDLTVQSVLPAGWPADALLVLHQLVPPALPAGSVLVIDPAGDSDLWSLGPPIENPLATESDRSSPLMNHVRLDQVVMPTARGLTFREPVHALAATPEDQPLYVQWNRPAGRGLLLNVDLDRSDIAFRTVFPILISNALNWFAGVSDDALSASATGSTLPVSLPTISEGRAWQLEAPDGRVRPIPAATATTSATGELSADVTIGPFDQAGVWRLADVPEGLATAGRASLRGLNTAAPITVAVNLSNARESDLRPPEALRDATADRRGTGPVRSGRPLWISLVLAASVLTGVEWWLYQRRVIE